MISPLEREVSSFRDPSGHILYDGNRIYRSLNTRSYTVIQSFLQSPAYTSLLAQELIIPTYLVDPDVQDYLTEKEGLPDRHYIRHKKLDFITYPYEWTPQMLLDAAQCTLRIQLALMEYGFSLKDASAYNIQFNPTPVFIDLGSIQPLTVPTWIAYKQFISHFLLPLFLYQDMDLDFRGTFLTELDGFDPEQAYCLLGIFERFLSPYLTSVTIPHLLRKKEGKQSLQSNEVYNPEKALFVMNHTIRSLQKKINSLHLIPRQSQWEDYSDQNSYNEEAKEKKFLYVTQILNQLRPNIVLDIGCNTGEFSLLATRKGSKVVSLELDIPSLESLYTKIKERKISRILPLRIDITNPSPAIGWRNQERSSFLDRIGRVDCIFALAIVHHLLVTKGIPLPEIANLFYNLTSEYLLVELIGPSDSMFSSLTRGRSIDYSGLSLNIQEEIFTKYFSILESYNLQGMVRTLYLMRKK